MCRERRCAVVTIAFLAGSLTPALGLAVEAPRATAHNPCFDDVLAVRLAPVDASKPAT